MASTKKVAWGCVGLGGYARGVCMRLRESSGRADESVELRAVCEPDQQLHAELMAELRSEGVKVFERCDDLFAEPIDAVWLPLPIDLHRSFTERALSAGKAVMCEKPAAGSVDDIDAMIAARDRAGLAVAIGYQDIYDPTTLPLKRRLLDGLVGPIESATLHAVWPRGQGYYERSTWAGRFKRDGVWVMDSPAQNALAHFINLALFLMGSALHDSAEPTRVEAELYRANPNIENYDTISMRVGIESGATLMVLLTHAGADKVDPIIDLHGSQGRVRFTPPRFTVTRADHDAQIIDRNVSGRYHMAERFARYIRGENDDHIGLATLEVARAHLVAVNAASQAAPIVPLSEDALTPTKSSEGGMIYAITGIESIFEQCARRQVMLHDSGLVDWARPASTLEVVGYNHFAGPAG